ncbi:hypothetical protein LVD15_04155 [Fulvivirga maritima]|uniref:hypothetical protein n=1 Tax=Fulvivirga maritima TaxID=2904247 RepID=UPI001F27144A|nr:hypothetical protein [Fulvivirga maritima]UII27627.1 hypothetical protein LVD15_04155 [Fulvivirga maritima]
MKITASVFEQISISGILKQNPTILLWDRPEKSILKRFNLKYGEFLVGAKGLSIDININTKFDILFTSSNPESFLEVEVFLESVYLNPSRVIDHLPNGYTNLCLLSFKKGLPKMLNRLKLNSEQKDSTKHDVLYLTQRRVLSDILSLSNENL